MDETLQAGRDAVQRHAWPQAFEQLSAADGSGELAPEDLEALGDAAWWVGRLDEALDAYERAYAGYVRTGSRRRAAQVALKLADHYAGKLSWSVSAGWQSKAERLLADEPESPEHAYLALSRFYEASAAGDFDRAYEQAQRVSELGERFQNPDLQALGMLHQGIALVRRGDVAEGLPLIDEASAAATGGEVEPYTAGAIYCATIVACRDLADWRRAGEWAQSAKRWCERQSISGFPGVCRVHGAEVARLQGEWERAEQDLKSACDELLDFVPLNAGLAFKELGEIRLRRGDLAAAEEALERAHELGRTPQPGLALLRLAQGDAEAAAASIKRALDEQSKPLQRAQLLPAQAEIAFARGELYVARAAAEELESIAGTYGSAALQASAHALRGAVQLAEGNSAEAVRSLKRAVELWQEVGAPYEAARARALLADAYGGEGDDEPARLERKAAKSTFERLEALPDLRRVDELLGAPGPRVTRTFMFTDVVSSTELVKALGDERWENLLRWHDRTLRGLFSECDGKEIKQVGDGFLVAFPDSGKAIEAAIAIQRALTKHARDHGFAPEVRIGLHAAEATERGGDVGGQGVHEAARIAALAAGGEILASAETLAAAAKSYPASSRGTVELKGLADPVEVVAIEWR